MGYTLTLYDSGCAYPAIVEDRKEGIDAVFNLTYASAFAKPSLPMIIVENGVATTSFGRWGLIPSHTRDEETAEKVSFHTTLARSESVWEKVSFRNAIRDRRSLIPVRGFIEWHHKGNEKIPHHVRLTEHTVFTLGAVWEDWHNRRTGEVSRTFAILTTVSNALMSVVKNTKLRMPVIIPPADHERWLRSNSSQEIVSLMQPYPDGEMEAWPITKDVAISKVVYNQPELLEAVGSRVVV